MALLRKIDSPTGPSNRKNPEALCSVEKKGAAFY